MKDKILNEVEFELLMEFQKYLPGAVIAGGSVRDMQYGLPYSDVDIFYNAHIPYAYIYDELIPKIFSYTHQDKFWRVTNSAFSRSDSIYGEDTFDIVELEKKSGSRYQFIAVHGDPKGHIHKFDLNCCKTYHDGKKLHNTGDFKDFWKTKELNVADNYKNSKYFGSGRLNKRVDKVMFRYKHIDIKISAFLEEHLRVAALKEEENKKKIDAREAKITATIKANASHYAQQMNAAHQQMHDNAALAQTQPGAWIATQGATVINPYFSTSFTTSTVTNPSTGNPFVSVTPPQPTSSLWADDVFAPVESSDNYSYVPFEPVPDVPEQA